MWEDGLRNGPARPNALARKRRNDRPSSAITRTTYKLAGSISRLFSAFAAADLTALAIGNVAFCGMNRRSDIASLIDFPLMALPTSRTLRGDIRTFRAIACTSIAIVE